MMRGPSKEPELIRKKYPSRGGIRLCTWSIWHLRRNWHKSLNREHINDQCSRNLWLLGFFLFPFPWYLIQDSDRANNHPDISHDCWRSIRD
jgi:hypothetical protein